MKSGDFKGRTLVVFAFSFFYVSGIAFAQVTSPEPRAWPEDFYQAAMAEPRTYQYVFTEAFFDNGGAEATLFKNAFDTENTFPLGLSRAVYNNFDLFGSSTIVDTFHVRANEDLLGIASAFTAATTLTDFLSFPFFNIELGAKGFLDIKDAKQTFPTPVLQPSSSPVSDIEDVNPYLNSSPITKTIKTTVEQYLEPLALPIKLPFTRNQINKMVPGEVISYTVNGQIGFGGSVGWKVFPTHIIDVGASVGMETYLTGEFEISVMKDDERYARVRVARLSATSEDGKLFVGAEFQDILKGFFLLKNTPLSGALDGVTAQVVPFELDLTAVQEKNIAVGYRYDLNSTVGLDCFHRAVLGLLTHSETAATAEAGDANPSVVKLYTSTINEKDKSHSLDISLSFFFGDSKTDTKQNLNTAIQLPTGANQVFSSIEDDDHSLNEIWGNNENQDQKLTVSVDQGRFSTHKENAILLSIENTIEDSQTNAKELNQYARTIESFLEVDHLFPPFPAKAPNEKHPNELKNAAYGQSSFYYGYSISEKALDAFLHSNESSIVSRAKSLGIKMTEKAILAARAAYDSRDSQKTTATLSALFNDKKHQNTYPKLILYNQDPSLTDKYLVAQNPVFGNVQYRGHELLALEQLLQVTADTSGNPAPSSHGPKKPVSEIQNLHASIGPDQKVSLHFSLSSQPEFLFFHLTPLTQNPRHKQDVDLIVFNRANRFVSGDNTLLLDPTSGDDLIHRLTAQLIPSESVIATVGYSTDGKSWTGGMSTTFNTSAAY